MLDLLEVYYSVLAICILQRLFELRYSRQNQQHLINQGFEVAESLSAYRAMVVIHVLWFLGMLAEPFIWSKFNYFTAIPAISWCALAVFILAQFLRLWVFLTLGVQWNTTVYTPRSTTANSLPVLTSGPYRYIRHPNYLAVVLEFVSLPLIGGAYFTAAICSILNGIILYRRILVEEYSLLSRPYYQEQMSSRARLVPGIW